MNRKDKFQRIRHIIDFERVNQKFLEIKKEFDALEEDTARRHEAYRQEFGKEMRKATDEYQRALAEYEKYVTGPMERINTFKHGKRSALKKKMEPYYKKLELHPGRPRTTEEQYVDSAAEITRLKRELEHENRPQWVKDLEQYEQEQKVEQRNQLRLELSMRMKEFEVLKRLEKINNSQPTDEGQTL